MFILKTNRDWRTNQISQSVKLASQRRNRDRSGKDNKNSYFWKTKTKLVVRSIAIKEECYVLKKKRCIEVKNPLLQWVLQNILEN